MPRSRNRIPRLWIGKCWVRANGQIQKAIAPWTVAQAPRMDLTVKHVFKREAMRDGADSVNKYTFHWSITPVAETEYTLQVPPFEVVARGNTVTLSITITEVADELSLREQAKEIALNLARSLSYEHRERFEVAFAGSDVLYSNGGQSTTASYRITVKPETFSTGDSADVEVRDAAGNVIDSSAIRRERQRQVTHDRISARARRAAIDANLRDVLDHWSRYAADSDGRLHPLYDVLQVAERLYGNRRKVALELKIADIDLSDLGRISNDPTVLNGRHPGKTRGPHRIASEAEVNTCERVARTIIESHASKIVI